MAYNILIVDDSTPMRAVIKKVTRASGFDIGTFFEAANGAEALAVLDANWMDLVLTDYNMPDMDGLTLLKKMKADDCMQTVPVVMVTTEGSHERVETFMACGAAAYIKKPFTPEAIRQTLNTILGEPEDGQEPVAGGNEGLDF
ncbi:response regulator [Desulfosarcina sp.]|uniref:response regulator n=1 Tax=Desulfosarcina sp. TaxID=2027861 RepID=UPI003970AAE5